MTRTQTKRDQSAPASNGRTTACICLALAVVTAIVYARVLTSDFVNFDDDRYVTANPEVQGGLTSEGVSWAMGSVVAGNWHPVTVISHMLDWQIWGPNPLGHHLTSLILHILNVLLLFLGLRRMTGSLWRSATVAALFALHPMHVESVAWVAERKDVLSTFFLLLSMGAYAEYADGRRRREVGPQSGRGRLMYGLVIACFALGLMSKPMLVTLPLLLLVLAFWPLTRLKTERPARLLLEKLPLFAMSLVSAVATIFAQRQDQTVISLETYSVGVRIANALTSVVEYLWKTAAPIRLAVFYPHPGTSRPAWAGPAAALLVIALTIAAVRTRGRFPYLTSGWIWYLVSLVPVIGLVQVGDQAMADRYTYIPHIGLFVAAVWGLADMAARWMRSRTASFACAGAVLLVLAVLCWIQVGVWHSSETLFRHALRVTKNNYLAHSNLGTFYGQQGRSAEAEKHFMESIRIRPNHPDAHLNLAVALFVRGDWAGAWKQVHLGERLGGSPPPGFVEALQQKMPEPPE